MTRKEKKLAFMAINKLSVHLKNDKNARSAMKNNTWMSRVEGIYSSFVPVN